MKKVMLTGGTGFIGRHVLELLFKEGYQVHALVRNRNDLNEYKSIQGDKIKLFQGSLDDIKSLENAAQDCDSIMHIAGVAKQWDKDPMLFEKINVQGTENIFKVAKDLGIKRVLNTSTAGTIAPSGQSVSDEATPYPFDYFFEYEKSKAKAEQIARDYNCSDLEIVTVNPTRVYGPGKIDQSNSTTLMFQKYLEGKWKFIPGNGEQYGSFVYVEDIAKGMLLALESGKAGQRYILGGENANYNQFFKAVKAISGVDHKLYHMPLGIIKSAARISTFLAERFKIQPFMVNAVARKLTYNWKVSSAKAEKDFGYTYRSLNQGLEQTYHWLEEQS
jgi:farnesol dehydrogenase